MVARFTIHVPQRAHGAGLLMSTAAKDSMDTLLETVRDTLTAAGLHGRHVHRNIEHDLGDERHSKDLIHIDAEDDPTTRHLIETVGEGIKALTGQPNVYVTVQPLETWLI